MKLQTKLFIDGRWQDASDGATFPVLNPATNEKLADVSKASKEDLARAVASARRTFTDVWGGMNPFERSRHLHKVADAVERNAEFLAGVESDDVGKPIYESRAIDVGSVAQTFRYFADIAVDIGGEVIPNAFNEVLDYTIHEPIGVIGAIIPWNFPFLTAARKIGSALAAGNTVVIKPASWAPLSTLLMGELFTEAGVPAGVLNIVPSGGADAGEVLSQAEGIGEISFTGSTEIGRSLLAGCSDHLKGCTLELGGKSPAVVLPDCNMQETVDGVLFGVYLNQGECCCAATRIIVHEDVYEEFVERFVAGSKAIKVGLPREESTRMGPLVHADHLHAVMAYVEAGKREGAKLACGGHVIKDGLLAKGNFMEPTVFTEVTPAMKIWKEEIFGPVVTITKAKSVEELVTLANDTAYGLAASIWTTDLKYGHTLAAKIHAGTVWCNLHNFVFPCAPYGGFKASGIGRELGREGVLSLTHTKTVMVSLFGGNGFKWY